MTFRLVLGAWFSSPDKARLAATSDVLLLSCRPMEMRPCKAALFDLVVQVTKSVVGMRGIVLDVLVTRTGTR
jgi:hypothetical protein